MLELGSGEFDLGDLLTDVVARFPEPVQANIVVNLESNEALVAGDRLRIGTVIRNLIDNASKYAPDSTVRATVSVQPDGILLRVEDDGPGLPAGAEEIVFDRFMRLDDRLSRETGGVGLGLTISRGIVQAHGGLITARRLAKGVAFEVRLPASDHEALAHVLHGSTP